MTTHFGTSGIDTIRPLSGGGVGHVIYGYAEGDPEDADAGGDLLEGGEGDDRIYGGGGHDTILGGGGADNFNRDHDLLFGGSGNDTLDGGTGNGSLFGGGDDDTLFGSDGYCELHGDDGNDTIHVFDSGGDGTGGGTWVYGGLGNDIIFGQGGAYGSRGLVEYLNGGDGNDTVYGGLGGARLHVWGDAGDDVIEMGPGNHGHNSIWGGSGADSILGGNGHDDVQGDDADSNPGNDVIDGRGGVDYLYGGGGDDRIDGGTGNDLLYGGGGNDLFLVDATGDIVVEADVSGGIDRVEASASFTLGANVENLWLREVGAIFATGNALANELLGNAADNTLAGRGGNDHLDGGTGVDEARFAGVMADYSVSSNPDGSITVTGLNGRSSEGSDHPVSIERLRFDDATWLANLTPTEIGLSNSAVRENAANGTVVGTLWAKDADSTSFDYTLLDAAGGRFALSEGTIVVADRLLLDFDQKTSHVVQIEVRDGEGGVLVRDLTISLSNISPESIVGDARANTLVGDSGNDRLDGAAGADRLSGRAGNDTYIVGAGDVVLESSGGGTSDLVQASSNWTLGDHLEHLTLSGSSDLKGTGNALGNRLSGNGGDNSLIGLGGVDTILGGAGNDRLRGGTGGDTVTGGTGNDVFIFASRAEMGDVITDFRNLSGDNDRFHISAAGFGRGLVAGRALSTSQFQTANDNLLQGKAEASIRFIWEADATRLWYDSNGSGAGGLLLVADLQAGARIGAGDIWLF